MMALSYDKAVSDEPKKLVHTIRRGEKKMSTMRVRQRSCSPAHSDMPMQTPKSEQSEQKVSWHVWRALCCLSPLFADVLLSVRVRVCVCVLGRESAHVNNCCRFYCTRTMIAFGVYFLRILSTPCGLKEAREEAKFVTCFLS